MTLLSYVRDFAVRFIGSNHDSSWGTFGGNRNGEPFAGFVFMTVDRDRAEKAAAALGAAGLLCESTLLAGETVFVQADAIHGLTVGLRSLSK